MDIFGAVKLIQDIGNMKHLKPYKLFESLSEKLYHGNRKGDFPPEKKRFAGAIFLTSNIEFAKDFAGSKNVAIFSEDSIKNFEKI
jgi:hypothetical protein